MHVRAPRQGRSRHLALPAERDDLPSRPQDIVPAHCQRRTEASRIAEAVLASCPGRLLQGSGAGDCKGSRTAGRRLARKLTFGGGDAVRTAPRTGSLAGRPPNLSGGCPARAEAPAPGQEQSTRGATRTRPNADHSIARQGKRRPDIPDTDGSVGVPDCFRLRTSRPDRWPHWAPNSKEPVSSCPPSAWTSPGPPV